MNICKYTYHENINLFWCPAIIIRITTFVILVMHPSPPPPPPPTTTHTQPTTHTHIRGGWHTDFGADPVLIGVGIPLVCTIFCEPVVVFLPNFHGYIFVIKQRNKILASLPLFIRSQLQKTENSLWRGTSVFSENSYWLHIGFSKWKK